jgi:hypothetical protein
MCLDVLETASPVVLRRTQKSSLCKAIWLGFVCAHARSYVFITYENVSGSFETPFCFRNVRTLHELACVRKVVTRSLPKFLLVHSTCRHVRTKKACSHMNLRAHKRNKARSPEHSAFLDSSHDQCGERLTDAKDIAGWGVHAT